MTKREALVNRICVVLLLVGAVLLAVFAVRGEPQRPAVDATAAIKDAHFAFVTIRDLSYDRPDTEAMLESAWQSGLKAAAIPGKPRRSTLDDQEWALEADVEFLLTRARSRSVDAIIDSYIWGLAEAVGDPHTSYTPFAANILPGLRPVDGITAVRENERYARVIAITPNSPAERAGLRVNDLIRGVRSDHGGIFWNSALDIILDVYRGEEHATLKQHLKVNLSIDFGESEMVTVTDLPGDVTLITVSSFQGSASTFAEQLAVYERRGQSEQVIVDLRQNSGGAALNLSSLLRVLGYHGVLLKWENRAGQAQNFGVGVPELPGFTPPRPTPPRRVVVLVSGTTASAAEIVVWALRTHLEATVIGTNTRGILRGSYSHLVSTGRLSVATVRTLLGPDEVDLEGIGITPDIIVEQDNAGLAAGRDNVLERAIQLLTED